MVSHSDVPMIDRRAFLGAVGTAAVVIGFDPLGRRWVVAAEATDCPSFAKAPPIDGALLMDAAARDAVAGDQGNIVHRAPCAVLRPGTVKDISTMIRYCRKHAIPISARGQAHTTFGQSLCPGLVIENRYLNRIHSIGPDGADVDTGVLWKDLVTAAYEQKLTLPVLTGYTALTVGGTLSVGGIGGLVGGVDTGAQVDHVRRLEVVTGTAKIQNCSPDQGGDLFDAMLAGLGQCGVMTRATLDLVPAKERARTYLLHYPDNATAFTDLSTLLDRPGLDHIHLAWTPPGTASFVYQINATVYYELTAPPDDLRLVGGLSTVPVIQDSSYLDYVFRGDNLIDRFRATLDWDRLIKPWFNVWLPASTVEGYVGEVIPTLTRQDTGATGSVLLFPQRRARVTRPFLRLPEPDGSRWVFVFNILTASDTTGPGPTYTSDMLARNDRLFRRARDAFGGVLYPVGTVPFAQDDWRLHYGEKWTSFAAAKNRFDPNRILTPGPGIFSFFPHSSLQKDAKNGHLADDRGRAAGTGG